MPLYWAVLDVEEGRVEGFGEKTSLVSLDRNLRTIPVMVFQTL